MVCWNRNREQRNMYNIILRFYYDIIAHRESEICFISIYISSLSRIFSIHSRKTSFKRKWIEVMCQLPWMLKSDCLTFSCFSLYLVLILSYSKHVIYLYTPLTQFNFLHGGILRLFTSFLLSLSLGHILIVKKL